jgi:hypothetical protein
LFLGLEGLSLVGVAVVVAVAVVGCHFLCCCGVYKNINIRFEICQALSSNARYLILFNSSRCDLGFIEGLSILTWETVKDSSN